MSDKFDSFNKAKSPFEMSRYQRLWRFMTCPGRFDERVLTFGGTGASIGFGANFLGTKEVHIGNTLICTITGGGIGVLGGLYPPLTLAVIGLLSIKHYVIHD